MNAFLLAFWPNLCATVLGVVLGVPVALFVNRRVTAFQQKHEAAAESMRRNAALEVLIGACAYNVPILDRMRSLALEGRVLRNPDLQLTTWDAVGAVLSTTRSDPKLLQQLAHHWLRLQRLDRLNEEVFCREIGTLPAIQDKEMMIGMWRELHDGVLNLSAHATELAGKLAALQGVSTPVDIIVPPADAGQRASVAQQGVAGDVRPGIVGE